MKVELLQYTKGADQLCGMAAANCYHSSNFQKALEHSAGAGHESVIEHTIYTFRISGVSRCLLAQLTRHRLCSFSVESQRYVKMESHQPFVCPQTIAHSELIEKYVAFCREAINLYQEMLDAGIPAEDARYSIPQAVTTTIIMSCNARELKHILGLRCCNRAQWEIKRLADKMYTLVYPTAPAIFGKAGPGCVNGRGCHEAHPCGSPRKLEEWQGKKGSEEDGSSSFEEK